MVCSGLWLLSVQFRKLPCNTTGLGFGPKKTRYCRLIFLLISAHRVPSLLVEQMAIQQRTHLPQLAREKANLNLLYPRQKVSLDPQVTYDAKANTLSSTSLETEKCEAIVSPIASDVAAESVHPR